MGQPIDVATLPIKSSEKCETSAFGTNPTLKTTLAVIKVLGIGLTI
ncbi:hypothetical protein RYZ59_17570 [Citrobacter sp. HN-141]|nr:MULTISPECIES: hypothetical protein [unclassified Citrobacter]MDW2645371.1 hypothetical protein [Citrobacter sp. HN-141]MDW2654809.1 hypothetical protein [Citrobacter sp. HN-120]MDW2697946.1 hypothetical protein [Citrobacter sp. HN-144]